MKYVCLVYLAPEQLRAVHDRECIACCDDLQKSGHFLGGEALQPIDTAMSVRVRDGQVAVTDGPFVETKEHVAGFYLIDARDLNDALRIAAKIPPARVGTVEVRPVRELSPD